MGPDRGHQHRKAAASLVCAGVVTAQPGVQAMLRAKSAARQPAPSPTRTPPRARPAPVRIPNLPGATRRRRRGLSARPRGKPLCLWGPRRARGRGCRAGRPDRHAGSRAHFVADGNRWLAASYAAWWFDQHPPEAFHRSWARGRPAARGSSPVDPSPRTGQKLALIRCIIVVSRRPDRRPYGAGPAWKDRDEFAEDPGPYRRPARQPG